MTSTVNWDLLTRVPLKRRLYEQETYFREAMRDALAILGHDFGPVLHRSALLLVKPDGIAAGKLRPVLRFLAGHGLDTVGVRQPAFDRLLWRELWRYQLTAATLDRLALNDLIYVGRGVLLLLRAVEEGDLPATVRLAQLKGSADASRQRPGTLRHLLRQANRNLSFIHATDEPADIIRELGLLLGARERPAALAAMRDGALADADRERLDTVVAGEPERRVTFEPGDAAAEVLGALRRARPAGALQAAGRAEAIARLELFQPGAPGDWPSLAAAIERSEVTADRWAIASIGASMIVCDEPGREKMLGNPDPALWRRVPSAASRE